MQIFIYQVYASDLDTIIGNQAGHVLPELDLSLPRPLLEKCPLQIIHTDRLSFDRG